MGSTRFVRLLAWGVPATGVRVETLLDRGAESDVAEAEAAVERLAPSPTDHGFSPRDILGLWLRALLPRACGDGVVCPEVGGLLPCDGEIAWLRRAYRNGRGDRILGTTSPPVRSKTHKGRCAII